MQKLPDNFESYDDKRQKGFITMKNLKDKGQRVVGTFCSFVPQEIIYAAGAIPCGLCASSEEPIPDAESVLPANLCPLIKASYGFALTDKCPYFYFSDIIVGETTCDGKKKMYELMAEYKPMQVIHLPNIPDYDRSLEMWVSEVRKFKEGIEKHFNITITDDMLNESIVWNNKLRTQQARLYELGKYDPPAITGVAMNDVSDGLQFMFDDEAKYEKVEAVIEECEKNWHEGKYPVEPDPLRPRLIVSGGGYAATNEKTINVMEELGASIVCYEGCCGISSLRRTVDEDTSRDPIVRIAEKYLEVPCAVVSPNKRRMEQVADTIDEWKADGYVSITLHSCNPFAVETENLRRVCESKGIPLLHIQTDFTPGDEGQIRTRIEAFLEMIREKKREAMSHE